MQDLSARDGLSLLLSPLCSCLPRASTSADDLLGQSQQSQQPWYSPQPDSGSAFDPSHAWHPSDPSSRPADVLSLHSQSGRPARRRRRGGGDVSGSGGDDGSGLSRWTLVKAWFWGDARGRIRLEESDDELERAGVGEGGPSRANESFGLAVGLGEEDAVLLTPEEAQDVSFLQAQAEEAHARLSPSIRGSSVLGDDSDPPEEDEDRAARRARRHKRRRARELGLTIEQFDEGVAVGDITAPEAEAPDEQTGLAAKARSGRHRQHPLSSSGSAAHSEGHLSPFEDSADYAEHQPSRERRHKSRSGDRHHKRASISASSEGPSEGGLSASTLSTLDEPGPFTPQLGHVDELHEQHGEGGGKTRRSRSKRRTRAEPVSVVDEEEGEAIGS